MLGRWLAYLNGVTRRRAAASEADEELQFHIEQETAANVERGMTPSDARRQALSDLGGLEQTREAIREVRSVGAGWISRDVRDAGRGFRRRPVATAVAVASLAAAVGATTAVGVLARSLYFRDLRIDHPERLIALSRIDPASPENNQPLLLSQIEALQEGLRGVADVFAWDGGPARTIEAGGARYQGDVTEISGNFFTTMGVQAGLGRLLGPTDAAAQVAVLDYRCWRDRFGRAPDVLGKTIIVDGTPLTIVGITPESFSGINAAYAADAMVPIGFETGAVKERATYDAGARLAPSVGSADASAQLQAMWPSVLRRTLPPNAKGERRARFLASRIHVESLRTGTLGDGMTLRTLLRQPLKQLGALGVLVLLIAGINVTMFFLARAVSRRDELAVRAALGAGPAVLVRAMVVEGVLVAAAGAALGVGMARWIGPQLFERVVSDGAIRIKSPVLDLRPDALVAAMAVSVVMALCGLCALVIAWRAVHRYSHVTLHSSARLATAGSRTHKLLIAAQMACAVVLIAGASLVGRSLHGLMTSDAGFHWDDVLQMDLLAQPGQKVPGRTAYHRLLQDTLTRIPGVASVSFAMPSPFRGAFRLPVTVSPTHETDAEIQVVGPDFFRTMGMTLLAGRDFTWADDEHSPHIAIVSERFAREVLAGADPIGRVIDVPELPTGQHLQIVGVVSNASLGDLHSNAPRAVYTAATQMPLVYDNFAAEVRTTLPPAAVAQTAAQAVASLGRQYAFRAVPLQVWRDYALRNERLVSQVGFCSALVTTLLAAAGLHGQLSYQVATRQREIGVRVALGADRRRVISLILVDAALVTAAGVLLGIPAAIAGGRVVSSLLFGLSPHDPLTLAASVAGLSIVAVAAALIPARRAATIDAAVVLRGE